MCQSLFNTLLGAMGASLGVYTFNEVTGMFGM